MVMSEAPHPSLPSLGDTTVTLVTGDVSLPRALEGVRGGSWLRARPNGQLGQAKPHRTSKGTWAPESQQERSGHPREARPPNARAVEAGAVGARRMSRARPGAAAGTASSPGSPRVDGTTRRAAECTFSPTEHVSSGGLPDRDGESSPSGGPSGAPALKGIHCAGTRR